MKRGVTKGIVTFVIRPKNQAAGIGFGGTSGGSGLPSGVTATHPYALAGALGFGTGFSRAYIEGELLMHVVGLRESGKAEPPKTSGHPTASIPSQVAAEKLRDDPERSRLGASDARWFGAPRPRAQADTTTGNGSPTDKSWFGAARRLGPEADATTPRESLSAMTGPAQQVAENPQDESASPARAPAAEKVWFGASNGMSR